MKGTCKFCGQMRMVKADVNATEEELNELAVEDCKCDGAQHFRKKRTEAEIAKCNIDNLFADHYPCVAAVLKECIPLVQDGSIKKITLNVTSKVKATMNKTTKDSLLVNKTMIAKEELDTE